MKRIFKYMIIFLLNIGSYFLLQIIASFVDFMFFGSGNISTITANWVSACFAIFQILGLFFLYRRKVLLTESVLFVSNVVTVVCLFLYFVIYISGTYS